MKNIGDSIPSRIFDIINYCIHILFMLICFYPFYYLFIYSISDPRSAAKGIYFLPKGFTLSNYQQIFMLKGILNAVIISLSRTIIGASLTVFCCMMFAFLLTQKELPFRKFIYRMTIMTMYIGGGLIPYYIVLRFYGFVNNFLVYVVPGAISAFNVVLAKTYIEQLPADLEDSAKIDGAGYFTIFTHIIFPLSRPIVATIVVFSAVGQWNSWFDNYLFVTNNNLLTLQLILYNFLAQVQNITRQINQSSGMMSKPFTISPQAVRVTVTIVVTIPIILVYPYMQKYFIKGIMIGAIKG